MYLSPLEKTLSLERTKDLEHLDCLWAERDIKSIRLIPMLFTLCGVKTSQRAWPPVSLAGVANEMLWALLGLVEEE